MIITFVCLESMWNSDTTTEYIREFNPEDPIVIYRDGKRIPGISQFKNVSVGDVIGSVSQAKILRILL